MVQLRWYKSKNQPRVLQYRQKYNTTVYAGMPTEEQKLQTAKYEWSEWMDIPVFVDPGLAVVFTLGRTGLESLLDKQWGTVLVNIDPLVLKDGCLERRQGFDRCQWVTNLNVWQQPVIPDGRKEFMLIATRVALEEGFAVIAITDG